MGVTMQEVGDRAGVSAKTVSNVLKGYRYLRPETKERVEAAIRELGYKMNTTARNLRTQKAGAVTLALPELRGSYLSEFAQEVIEEASRRGLAVHIELTGSSRERELQALVHSQEEFSDGVILLPQSLTAADFDSAGEMPIVLVGEHVQEASLDHITVDNAAVAKLAVEHLFELGRRRIALLGAPCDSSAAVATARVAGSHTALAGLGLAPAPQLEIPVASWNRRAGAEAATILLDSGADVDALFCFNDAIALGALRALLQHGIRVPDDIAVIGVDGSDEARFSSPSLSTVALDIAALARGAFDLLARRWNDAQGANTPASVFTPFELRVGESTLGKFAIPID